jgi:aminoglycoside 6'-N-acetyltransferase
MPLSARGAVGESTPIRCRDSLSVVVHRTFPTSVDADGGVSLRLAQDSDAEVITEWMRAPEVHKFWGGRALAVDDVLAKYTGRRAPDVASYVICERGRSVGYVQAWQNAGRFGLDMFLAVEAQGRGLGPRAARALAIELTNLGWVPLTVDPGVDNPRAIGAWRAAGFLATGEFAEDDGSPTQLMSFSASLSAG